MSNPQIPPGAGPNIGQILQQAQRMQAELLTAQQELADARVDGTAGGGLVKATVTGGGELVDLAIDPAAVDPTDTETLADLVLAAVRDAADNARRLASERMGQVTGGLGDALVGSAVLVASVLLADSVALADPAVARRVCRADSARGRQPPAWGDRRGMNGSRTGEHIPAIPAGTMITRMAVAGTADPETGR